MHSVPNILMIKSVWLRWVEVLSCNKKNRIAYRVLVGNLKARKYLEDLSIDLSIILKHLEDSVWEGADWIHLTQDRDQWQVLVNVLMSFEVSCNVFSVLTSWITSLEGLYCSFCTMLLMKYALTFVISCVCLLHSSTLASAVGLVFLLLLFYTYWYCYSVQ